MKANKLPPIPCNNVDFPFKPTRDDKEFNDMTLACEDGELKDAHKVVPALTNPSLKSKAPSSIDLGWGICSSAVKKNIRTRKVFSQLLVRPAFAAKAFVLPFLPWKILLVYFFLFGGPEEPNTGLHWREACFRT